MKRREFLKAVCVGGAALATAPLVSILPAPVKRYTAAWAGARRAGKNNLILADVMAMLKKLEEHKQYGPYHLTIDGRHYYMKGTDEKLDAKTGREESGNLA